MIAVLWGLAGGCTAAAVAFARRATRTRRGVPAGVLDDPAFDHAAVSTAISGLFAVLAALNAVVAIGAAS